MGIRAGIKAGVRVRVRVGVVQMFSRDGEPCSWNERVGAQREEGT